MDLSGPGASCSMPVPVDTEIQEGHNSPTRCKACSLRRPGKMGF